MIKKIISLNIIISLTSFNTSAIECEKNKTQILETKVISKILDVAKKTELIDEAKKMKHKKTYYYIEPTVVTCSTLSYKIPEQKLNPNEAAYFHIPAEYRERGVRFMILGHRQEPDQNNKAGKWDEKPGLSSVQVFSKDKWSYWNGQASGKLGAKYAEPRQQPEIENLYDWDTLGHVEVVNANNSTKELLPSMMKVESIGKDPVFLSQLTLKIQPPKETSNSEFIYSKGTAFTPKSNSKKYKLGGGQAHKGTFPGSKELQSGEELVLPLESGKKITSIDIACGDSHQDQTQNSDGGWGQPGWAKLSVGIKSKDGNIKWLMKDENVPPEGVLMASPENCNDLSEKGDKLIIQSSSDTTYIMGVHIGTR